jgi:hypothetical protein
MRPRVSADAADTAGMYEGPAPLKPRSGQEEKSLLRRRFRRTQNVSSPSAWMRLRSRWRQTTLRWSLTRDDVVEIIETATKGVSLAA